MSSRRIALAAGAAALLAVATPALAQGAVAEKWRWLTFLVFGAIIGLTMFVTYVAAKRVKSAADFYTAGGGVSGLQNGWAIAGDYLSAASFLGIAGLISIWGYDGFMYSVGWLVAYITVLLVIAEPCRNIGKYTLADILAYRNNPKATRIVGAISVITVSTFYLTAQMVGGGVLVKTLIGIDYEISVVVVGVLMLGYVLFGGMVATTWVQIIKAALLVTASIVLVVMVWMQYGFFGDFLTNVVGDAKVQARVAQILGDGARNMSPAELGQRFLEPGLLFKAPIDQISLGMALVFGTAGLPHILMRFFTVPNAKEARKSVAWATTWIGYFYILTFIIGFGAITNLIPNPVDYFVPKMVDGVQAVGENGQPLWDGLKGGGNMAAVHLAKAVGGDVFMGFISAVAFATILAVVAGLTLSGASAVSHDLYASVWRHGNVDQATELRVSKITTVALGIVAVMLGVVFEKQNVAFMVMLAFAVACSANFPVLFMSVLWKNCTTKGAVAGGTVGLILSVTLTVLSPAVWEASLGHPKGSAMFPYASPAIFSMTSAFLVIWLVSLIDRSAQARKERDAFPAQLIRSETGVGAAAASAH